MAKCCALMAHGLCGNLSLVGTGRCIDHQPKALDAQPGLSATLQRFGGVLQFRARRADGSASVSLDHHDLGYALSVLQGFAS